MARRAPQHDDNPKVLQARESVCVADVNAPAGEWIVQRGDLVKSDHPAVLRCPELFVDVGDLITTGAYVPNPVA